MERTLPLFSIVIPTRDRPRSLAVCLGSLTRLDYPRGRFEVVVVDDGSAVALESAAAPFRNALDLMLVTQGNTGPAAARNRGAARARGEFLAFTDDDCAPASGWLRALAARFAAAPERAVGGRTVNVLEGSLCSAASQCLHAYVYRHYNTGPSGPRFFASNNFAVPAEPFRRIGGFDASFPFASEDRDFCRRWLRQGYAMSYAPEALVQHSHALTLSSFLHQHFAYGRGACHFHRARACDDISPLRLEPGSFYREMLRSPWRETRGARAVALAALLALSQAASAAGFFWEVARARRDGLPVPASLLLGGSRHG